MVPNLAPKSGTSSVPKIGFGRYSQTDQSQARSSHRRRARMRARSHSEQASHFLGPLSVPALGDGFRPYFGDEFRPSFQGPSFIFVLPPRAQAWGHIPYQSVGTTPDPKKLKFSKPTLAWPIIKTSPGLSKNEPHAPQNYIFLRAGSSFGHNSPGPL